MQATMSKMTTDSSIDSEGSYLSDSSDDELSYASPTNVIWTFTGNDAILHDISKHISHIWKEIGRYLLKKESLIENIDLDNDDEKEKAYQLLVEWHRMMGTKANVQCLQNVLEHIGRKDIGDTIPALYRNCVKLQRQQSLANNKRTKSETTGHIKLQKNALRALKRGVKFYQNEISAIGEMRNTILLENPESKPIEEQLSLKDIDNIRNELDSLQTQVYNMQENGKGLEQLDKQLRYVAKKLYEVEQTANKYCDKLDELQISYYSECRVGRFGRISCLFGSFKRRGSRREKRKPMKTEEVGEDVVSLPGFRLKSPKTPSKVEPSSETKKCHTYPLYHRNSEEPLETKKCHSTYQPNHRKSEEHFRRRLSSLDIETSEQLQELIAQDDEISLTFMDDVIDQCLPEPCYESSQTIFALLTKSPKNSLFHGLNQSFTQQEDICVITYLV